MILRFQSMGIAPEAAGGRGGEDAAPNGRIVARRYAAAIRARPSNAGRRALLQRDARTGGPPRPARTGLRPPLPPGFLAILLLLALHAVGGLAQVRTVNTGGPKVPSKFIIGGSTVSSSAYPYVALLQITTPSATNATLRTITTCSGTLIQSAPIPVVLTAAHCGAPGDEKFAKAFVGRGDLSVQCSAEPTCNEFNVELIIRSPGYPATAEQVDLRGNDVALWVLKSATGKAVTVPAAVVNDDPNFPPVGTTSRALGWGFTSKNGALRANATLATQLQGLDLTVAENANCEQTYGLASDTRANFACLKGSVVGGVQTSTCQGDSGGPHVADGRLFGVTSFGPSPCDDGSPLVAVRTSGHKAWIDGVFTTINSGGSYNASGAPVINSPIGIPSPGSSTPTYQISDPFWEWKGFQITGDEFVLDTQTAATKDDCDTSCRNNNMCWWRTYKPPTQSCVLGRPLATLNETYFALRYGDRYLQFLGVTLSAYGVVNATVFPAGTDSRSGERACREACTSRGYGCHIYEYNPVAYVCKQRALALAADAELVHAWRVKF